MGKWATTHSSKCFDNQPSFFHLLLETCQQDKLALVAAQMPEQLEVACWEVHLRCLNLLLAEVVGADITQAILCGKSARISAQVGHPDFLLRVDMGKNTSIHMTEAAASYTKYLHNIAETFCSSIADNSPCMVVCEFIELLKHLFSMCSNSMIQGWGCLEKHWLSWLALSTALETSWFFKCCCGLQLEGQKGGGTGTDCYRCHITFVVLASKHICRESILE